ncbi:MAG: class I SAM-dependent methyltransferase [Candidatus Yonathbacteria bacterium]|nr:class I SAM-dependent methyltransferase [Candidatus Yonathbacteria bacterium]
MSEYDASSLYNEDYFSGAERGSGYVDYDQDKEPMRSVFEEYLKRIESRYSRKGNLLDVGAATGFFVDIAQKMGWNACGLEISEYAAEIAQEKGLDVVWGTLRDGMFQEMSFNAITLWDVLEHFQNPNREIRACSKLLGVNGILALSTPDSSSWYARIMGKRWHLLVPPEHLHYFTQKSVKIFLERNNFDCEEIIKIGKTFTLEYILHTVAEWQKSSLLRKVVRFLKKYPRLGGFAISINLRDNMVVIVRKK